MADGKLTYDADFGAINNKADQTRKKVEGIGDAAAKTGNQFGMWGRQISGAVTKMAGIVSAINAVGAAAAENTARLVEANRKSGGETLSRSDAAQSLGMNGNAINAAITGPSGSVAPEEMDSFLSSVVNASKNARVPFKSTSVMAALSARSSGLYNEKELLDMLQKGGRMPMAADVEARRGRAGDETNAELQLRARERTNNLTAQRLNAPRGAVSREAQSVMDRRRAESPVSWGISDIGTHVWGLDTLIQADRQFAAESEVRKNLEKIAETNKQMATPRMVITTDPANAPR